MRLALLAPTLLLIACTCHAYTIPRPQQRAPDFTAVAATEDGFVDVSLSGFEGKYVLLLFYPFDFTFVCPTELIGVSDRMDDFERLNTVVLGVSCDSKWVHHQFLKTPRSAGGLEGLRFPLVADTSGQMARDYGVLLEEGADAGAALRGTFIMDGSGTVRHVTVNDLSVGRSVDELLRVIEAFQFTDANDSVCPMSWKPGSATILPHPDKKMEYFAAVHDEGQS